MTYKFAETPFNGKYQTSNLMTIVMFALSLTVYEIFANQEIFKTLTFKIKKNV